MVLAVISVFAVCRFSTIQIYFLREPFSRNNNNFRVLRFFRIAADPASGAYRKHSFNSPHPDQMLVAAQGSSLASLLGPLLGVQSGFFSTPDGRLRQHLNRLEKSHGTKFTDEQKAQYLLKTPLIAVELLPEALRKAAYRASRKRPSKWRVATMGPKRIRCFVPNGKP